MDDWIYELILEESLARAEVPFYFLRLHAVKAGFQMFGQDMHLWFGQNADVSPWNFAYFHSASGKPVPASIGIACTSQ